MYIPWSRILFDMPVVTLLVKKFPTFCGTERFISMLIRPSLSQQDPITIFRLFKVSTLRRMCVYVFCLLKVIQWNDHEICRDIHILSLIMAFSMLVAGHFVCWINECLCWATKSIEDSAVGVGRSCSLDMQVLLLCVCVWREEWPHFWYAQSTSKS